MAKNPTIESHIADSQALIEKAKPETVETERHIEETRRALERSRKLLAVARDPLLLAKLMRDMAVAAAKHRPETARNKPASRKAPTSRKAGRRR